MTSITPFLWFEDQLEEAMNFYVSALRRLRRGQRSTGSPMERAGPWGQVMVAYFPDQRPGSDGPQRWPGSIALSPAFSFFVSCEDQAEVDRYWDALCAEGGEPGNCGWLVDRFGLSWQIVPTALGRLDE